MILKKKKFLAHNDFIVKPNSFLQNFISLRKCQQQWNFLGILLLFLSNRSTYTIEQPFVKVIHNT